MDDAGTFVQRDLVPGNDAVLDLRRRRKIVERAAGCPQAPRRAPAPRIRRLRRSTAYHSPLVQPYSASGLTAAATFAGSVQGVVVQTTRLAFAVEQREANEERRVLSPVLAE